MKIGILSKRTGFFTGDLKIFYESEGHLVTIYTKENLCINESLLKNDLYILKSKHQIPFIYAGVYLEAYGIPVIPTAEISYKHRNRLEAYLLIKNAGLLYPHFYYGTLDALKTGLSDNDFPLILKPIMGSGSKGVKIINKLEDIKVKNKEILYLEKFIDGIHYTVYFISKEICTLKKKPLKNEHSDMIKRETSKDIKNIIFTWKNKYNLLFGHLDIVKEKNTGKLFIVDAGSFPEFTNWKCEGDPVSKIGNLILEEYKKVKNKKVNLKFIY